MLLVPFLALNSRVISSSLCLYYDLRLRNEHGTIFSDIFKLANGVSISIFLGQSRLSVVIKLKHRLFSRNVLGYTVCLPIETIYKRIYMVAAEMVIFTI